MGTIAVGFFNSIRLFKLSHALFGNYGACDGWTNLVVDVGNCPQYTFSTIPTSVAISEFHGLFFSG